jgi:membrane protein required for colicin V production
MPIVWIDLVILGIIGLSVLTGLIRGFVKELVALCIWVLAIWVAYKYAKILDPWLLQYIEDNTFRSIAAFVIILVGMLVAGAIVNAVLSYLLKRSGLSGTDRLLGMIFGFVRGVFIVALIMLVVSMTSLPYKDYAKESRLYSQFDPVVNWLSTLMPKFFKTAKLIPAKNLIDLEMRG